MAKLQVSLQKQGWVLPQALLEHFAAHQQMSLSFECVSIIGYPNHSDETTKGQGSQGLTSVRFRTTRVGHSVLLRNREPSKCI